MSQSCYTDRCDNTTFHSPCIMPACANSAHYMRISKVEDFHANITSADFIAYLDDKAWLIALNDLLMFCEKRILDSDYYQKPKQEQATAPATSN